MISVREASEDGVLAVDSTKVRSTATHSHTLSDPRFLSSVRLPSIASRTRLQTRCAEPRAAKEMSSRCWKCASLRMSCRAAGVEYEKGKGGRNAITIGVNRTCGRQRVDRAHGGGSEWQHLHTQVLLDPLSYFLNTCKAFRVWINDEHFAAVSNLQAVHQSIASKMEIDQRRRTADCPAREHVEHEFGAVLQVRGHELALLDPLGEQELGPLAGVLVRLRPCVDSHG